MTRQRVLLFVLGCLLTSETALLGGGTWNVYDDFDDGSSDGAEWIDATDGTAPAIPSVVSVSGDHGLSSDDGITNDQILSITGTSDADATIEVYIDTVSIGTTTADSGGDWTYDYTGTTLTEGAHAITATAMDAAGDLSGVSPVLSVVIDMTAPMVSLSTSASNSSTAFDVTATFSEPVTGFDAGDVTISNGTAVGVTGSGTTYTVRVEPEVDGNVSISVLAGGASDTAGNTNIATSGAVDVTADVPPTVNLTTPAVVVSGAFTVTATFSETVTGFAADDITVTNGTASTVFGSGSTYTFLVSPGSPGTVTVVVNASTVIDSSSQANSVSNRLLVAYVVLPEEEEEDDDDWFQCASYDGRGASVSLVWGVAALALVCRIIPVAREYRKRNNTWLSR